MKIVFLDAKTIGDDIDLSGFDALGEVTRYDFTTPEEAPERVKDADVLIMLLLPEPIIWIKTIWLPAALPGAMLPDIPPKQ